MVGDHRDNNQFMIVQSWDQVGCYRKAAETESSGWGGGIPGEDKRKFTRNSQYVHSEPYLAS